MNKKYTLFLTFFCFFPLSCMDHNGPSNKRESVIVFENKDGSTIGLTESIIRHSHYLRRLGYDPSDSISSEPIKGLDWDFKQLQCITSALEAIDDLIAKSTDISQGGNAVSSQLGKFCFKNKSNVFCYVSEQDIRLAVRTYFMDLDRDEYLDTIETIKWLSICDNDERPFLLHAAIWICIDRIFSIMTEQECNHWYERIDACQNNVIHGLFLRYATQKVKQIENESGLLFVRNSGGSTTAIPIAMLSLFDKTRNNNLFDKIRKINNDPDDDKEDDTAIDLTDVSFEQIKGITELKQFIEKILKEEKDYKKVSKKIKKYMRSKHCQKSSPLKKMRSSLKLSEENTDAASIVELFVALQKLNSVKMNKKDIKIEEVLLHFYITYFYAQEQNQFKRYKSKLLEYANIYKKMTGFNLPIGTINELLACNKTPKELILKKNPEGFELDLSRRNYPDIEGIQYIKGANIIKLLNLEENNLCYIPKEIKVLQKLTSLNLKRNQLTKLPMQLKEIKTLERLYCQSNQLKKVPEVITQMPHLKELNIANNGIKELPDDFGNLTSLESLNLSSNKLKTLPESFANLVNLDFLGLRFNKKLEKIPSLAQLKKLKEINMDIAVYEKVQGSFTQEQIAKINREKFDQINAQLEHLGFGTVWE